MELPADVARCHGVFELEDGKHIWREGCESCLRRTSPRPKYAWMLKPPVVITFECEYRIPPYGE